MAQQAYVVTDIGYGDTGKGTMVDYLVRRHGPAIVVRVNGGPQAAHNVVTAEGKHHTFSQFGSGMLVPGTHTHLAAGMLVNPLNMVAEADHLESLGVNDVWQRTSVHQDALVILPWHQAANQLRELTRGSRRHGSCGQGVGEAKVDNLVGRDSLTVGDLSYIHSLSGWLQVSRKSKYEQLQEELEVPDSPESRRAWQVFTDDDLIPWLAGRYADWASRVTIADNTYLARLSHSYRTLLLEGAQGVLLDEWHGFYPYTTWSTTTHLGAEQVLETMEYGGQVTCIGVLRGYMTRHGAGPLVTEDKELTAKLPDYHNGYGTWQQGFRVGWLDLVAHRYALRVCGTTDQLAVTGLDRLQSLTQWRVCNRYRYLGNDMDAGRYLEFDQDGLVRDIRVLPVGDWHNPPTRPAELLAECRPVYREVRPSAGAEQLLQTIEDDLGLPISVTSFGPTVADKYAHSAR